MSETAYKAVTADLKSPFIPWADSVITYAIGDTFDALPGLEAMGLTGPMTDWPDRGIIAFASSADYWLRPFGADPIPGARYLELSYDLADVLAGPMPDGSTSLLPGTLSLASVSVVAEVFP